MLFFFFNDTATTEIYTLSLHDALPICRSCQKRLAQPVERCLSCGELRRAHRRVHGRAECAACAKARMRQRIDCQRCHQRLRPAATDRSLCERCAGEPVLHECRLCRAQSDSYDQGRCPACGLRERLDQLRAEADPEALARLEPYLAALAASPNPWSTVRWMRTRRSYQTLRMLARGGVDLSHEALDAAGGGPSIEHLRDALVAQGCCPRGPSRPPPSTAPPSACWRGCQRARTEPSCAPT